MNNLEYKRNFIQERKLDVLRQYHENVGRLKALAFEFTEQTDLQKKENIFKQIEIIKKVIRKQLADVDMYNEFLATGKVKRKAPEKGSIIDIEV